MEEALAGVQNIRRIVDDVVVFDRDRELHILHVREILCRCEEKGISLNRENFKFCSTEARFAGFKLTPFGYSVRDDIIEAIAQFELLAVALIFAHFVVWSISLHLAPMT